MIFQFCAVACIGICYVSLCSDRIEKREKVGRLW
jgi:hypothetical protein